MRLKDAPYWNPDIDVDTRIEDLLERMTLEEKVSQMVHQSRPVRRLGIPGYNWWNEALHGVARAVPATVFPQPIGLAATFDARLVRRVAAAVSDEARAVYHTNLSEQGDAEWYMGLTFWSPNINIFRDPRWGRGHETFGEDPWLSGELGAAYVRGLQGDHPVFLKTAACAKHFAVHSGPEPVRHEFDARVDQKDLAETYLPAFKRLVEEDVEAFMGAYNRANGEVCCGSPTLLGDILRGQWGFRGHVVSDCGAITDFHKHHKVTATPAESAALALRNGCDLNCGSVYDHLLQAVEEDLLTEEDIDRSLRRLLSTRFRLGMFDPPERNPFARQPVTEVSTEQNRRLAREVAQESVVLLKNDDQLLPLRKDMSRLGVVGPTAADVQVLLGNYNGLNAQLVTLLEGVVGKVSVRTSVYYHAGCHLTRDAGSGPRLAGMPSRPEVVIVGLGLTTLHHGEEGEAMDNTNGGDLQRVELPEAQLAYLRAVAQRGIPIVAVVSGGGALAIPEVHELADAVLMMWYPGEQGGNAIGDILFGDAVPTGRLPVTCPFSTDDLPPFDDYAMEGRTYRYPGKKPLYPFGFGLSYTRFDYRELTLSEVVVDAETPVTATLTLANAGSVPAAEVVQLYVSALDAPFRVPDAELKAVERVTLQPGEEREVRFEVTPDMLAVVDEQGDRAVRAGTYRITCAGAAPTDRSRELGAPEPVAQTVTIR